MGEFRGIFCVIIVILFSSVFLTACDSRISDADRIIINNQIICNSPYVRFETGCCLDQNNNSVCDDEDLLENHTPSDSMNNSPNVSKKISLVADMPYEKVISNSRDWRDVYSTMLYTSLMDKPPGLFLRDEEQGMTLPYDIQKDVAGILIVSSKSNYYIWNYKDLLMPMDYMNVQELKSDNINLDLAKQVYIDKVIKKFIVVDDTYGYDAISAVSYAVADDYYVLLSNINNSDAIVDLFSEIIPEKIIILGPVNEDLKIRLEKYNPEIIDNGDRFSNNIEMVKKTQQITSSTQILLSNGEYIEKDTMSSNESVVFIGKDVVPTQVMDYLERENFESGTIPGSIQFTDATARRIRQQTGMHIFVKMLIGEQTPRITAEVAYVEVFLLPKYDLDIRIYSITHSKDTNTLSVKYKNNATIGTYLKSTITITSKDKGYVVEDTEPQFIEANQYKTINYTVELTGQDNKVKLSTVYGDSPNSMDRVVEAIIEI